MPNSDGKNKVTVHGDWSNAGLLHGWIMQLGPHDDNAGVYRDYSGPPVTVTWDRFNEKTEIRNLKDEHIHIIVGEHTYAVRNPDENTIVVVNCGSGGGPGGGG